MIHSSGIEVIYIIDVYNMPDVHYMGIKNKHYIS